MPGNKQSCTKTTCPYCGVGCGVDARLSPSGLSAPVRLVSVKGSAEHPANLGKLCVKGSALHESIALKPRLLHPELKGERSDWDTALSAVSKGLSDTIAKYGKDSVAFYLSGQLLTEDYYVANKLMKGFIGSANVDTNSRLCMSSAVAGYKRAFGEDLVPCNYEDLENCDLLILIGSNAAWTHPVLYQRMVAAKAARPAMKIIVIDPRQSASCDIADLFLPILPGSDSYLFVGLLNYLARHNILDTDFIKNHSNGFEATLAAAQDCTLEEVARQTGLPTDLVKEFFQLYAGTPRTVSFYSQGINQSATGSDKCNAIINCHLATGRIGKPGMGPFSITGQPNAMGGREVGGLANQLAAHMDFDIGHRETVSRFWQTQNLASSPGLKAVDLFDAMAEGKIKAVWIMATNPLVSLPDSDKIRQALEKCELVIVSDCIRNTDTNAYADILLPATGWSEKDGTVTNSERCISRQRALLAPAGDARHDWQIICEVAQRMGFDQHFNYQSASEIFSEHAELSGFENNGTRKFDISALARLNPQQYDNMQPVRWPVNKQHPQGCERLFTDRQFPHPDGKACFIPVNASLPSAKASVQYPYLLNSGRLRDQWHTMTRTGYSPRLTRHSPAPFVAVSKAVAKRQQLHDGDLLQIRSSSGSALLPVKIDNAQKRNELFIPVHWNKQFAISAKASALYASRVDPVSGQPESKIAAVALDRITMQKWVSCISSRPLDTDSADYWHKRDLGHGQAYRLAYKTDSNVDLMQQLASLYPDCHTVDYHDEATGTVRQLYIADQKLLAAVYISQSQELLPEDHWLHEQLAVTVQDDAWLLLSGQALNQQQKGQLICSCFEVGKTEIMQAIASGASTHAALGKQLRCGTNCGSCIPELKLLIRESAQQQSELTEHSTADNLPSISATSLP